MQDLFQALAEHIEAHGRGIIGVGGDADTPTFAYTIGNSLRGYPELLTIGMEMPLAHSLLNAVSVILEETPWEAPHSLLVPLGGPVPVKLVRAQAGVRDQFTIQAGQFLQTEAYPVYQLLCPDKEGRFPDDPRCEEPYASQPVFAETVQ